MAGVRIADGFSNIHIRRRVVGLKVFDFTPHLQQALQIGAAARVTAVLDIVKQMAPNPVSIFPAFSQESFKIQWRCRIQCRPISVSRCVGSKPIRDAAALVSGPPCNRAVGEALLAQSLKRGKYFLTGLSVLQAGSAVLCRSAGDRIFGENGSNMGVAINAHLFLDCLPEILDQMNGQLPGGPAVRPPGLPGHIGHSDLG